MSLREKEGVWVKKGGVRGDARTDNVISAHSARAPPSPLGCAKPLDGSCLRYQLLLPGTNAIQTLPVPGSFSNPDSHCCRKKCLPYKKCFEFNFLPSLNWKHFSIYLPYCVAQCSRLPDAEPHKRPPGSGFHPSCLLSSAEGSRLKALN